jgi:amino acid adenylation domain-containing protein
LGYLLQHLLELSAKRAPERQAVRMGDRVLTYGELDRAADQVAACLIELGMRPGDRVGLHVGKSVDAITAICGVLKAGGVYVPLDPVAPGSRLGYILKDCAVRIVLTGPEESRRGRTESIIDPADSLDAVVVIGDAGEPPQGLPARRVVRWRDALSGRVSPHALVQNATTDTDLAYILYTSGSTGEPKGVMISHRNALTFVEWCADMFAVSPEDRVSNHAPFHFDLSIFDVFVALKCGASIHPVPEGLSTFPMRLAEWIERERITVWYSVPSVLTLAALHGKLAARDLAALRLVLFAGEVFPIKHLQLLISQLPAPRYFNLYGPTETNVCTYHEVDRRTIAGREVPLPIGRACANFGAFAVTDGGQLANAPGQVGELLVRGSGVALGYWGRPERTAKGFVQNPLEPRFRDVVYRTGDLVTLDENGEYLFLGRSDHQIKTRGYRVELGEIESVLYGHKLVREVAVIAVPDELIGNRIRAVVSLTDGSSVTEAELQSYCADQLPRYMVPETVEFKVELPRTLNGKVDRVALAAATVRG